MSEVKVNVEIEETPSSCIYCDKHDVCDVRKSAKKFVDKFITVIDIQAVQSPTNAILKFLAPKCRYYKMRGY